MCRATRGERAASYHRRVPYDPDWTMENVTGAAKRLARRVQIPYNFAALMHSSRVHKSVSLEARPRKTSLLLRERGESMNRTWKLSGAALICAMALTCTTGVAARAAQDQT